MEIRIIPDRETLLADNRVHYLALQFTAPPYSHEQRRPVAFCLVIDRSGSTTGPPLDAAKKSAQEVLNNLRHDDYFSLVAFGDSAEVIVPLQSELESRKIIEKIDAILPRGSTNLIDGWMRGRDELRKAPPGTPRRLLLMTDGRLNVGVTEPDEVLPIIEAGRDNHSIATSCLGFGDSYDDKLLDAIANRCSGSFYDLDSLEELSDIFAAELRNLQQVAVENLQLRIRPLDLCRHLAPLAEIPFYRNDDGELAFRIGNLVSGEKRTLIFATEISPTPASEKSRFSTKSLIEIEATFESRQSRQMISQKWNQIVQTHFAKKEEYLKINPEVIGIVFMQQAVKTLSAAIADAEFERIPEAKARLKAEIGRLEKKTPSVGASDGLRLLKDFLEILNTNGKWTTREQKMARYRISYYRKMSSRELWLGDPNSAPLSAVFKDCESPSGLRQKNQIQNTRRARSILSI